MSNELLYADLHMHTPNSDGKVTLSELPQIAKENNLGAVAITDHDRIHSELSDPLEVIDGIDVINGIELRLELEEVGERVDILGYGVEPTTRLKGILDDIRYNRIERSNTILDLIEEETGVYLDMDISDNTGRPHIARAIDESTELDYTYDGAFEELIGNDCPAYASRDIPLFKDGIDELKNSCHFVSLAHPFRYDNPISALKFSQKLDGVECLYPYDKPVSFDTPLDEIAVDWFDLTMTGGSDAHDIESIGSCGLMKSHYDMFLKESGLEEYTD